MRRGRAGETWTGAVVVLGCHDAYHEGFGGQVMGRVCGELGGTVYVTRLVLPGMRRGGKGKYVALGGRGFSFGGWAY